MKVEKHVFNGNDGTGNKVKYSLSHIEEEDFHFIWELVREHIINSKDESRRWLLHLLADGL